MKRILIMGGTSDANNIAKKLKELGNLFLITTTTTDFGGDIAKKYADVVISKPLDKDALKNVILNYSVDLLIDATHPFAVIASKNAVEVAKELNINYIRYERPSEIFKHEKIVYVKDFEEAAKKALEISNKKVFHMAGIKNLKTVVDIVGKDRVIARILPISINKALELLPPQNIVAMQGVFSKELNKYLILDYNCDVIITKESGDSGGFKEKILGALEADATPIVIKRPKIDYPVVFNDIDSLIGHIQNLDKNY
ncbi:precorrin-6A reductase [Methanotorris igneus]|uniref:Precorrin-6x reductase n=1 Tax=Methanotorris igneus (strain DSM 5666 / JCM 11834 / Kol 5) TaxID=880724 RepID=F6BBR5_METIK|nr:precorrin-6A reductase [Methanotorris igneus]AEF97195.1 precorrin-6x reductase [Methanotorris igneus Kol 5]